VFGRFCLSPFVFVAFAYPLYYIQSIATRCVEAGKFTKKVMAKRGRPSKDDPRYAARKAQELARELEMQRLTSGRNASGLPAGVSRTDTGRFQARIKLYGKRLNLGSYDTAEEAAEVYDRAKAGGQTFADSPQKYAKRGTGAAFARDSNPHVIAHSLSPSLRVGFPVRRREGAQEVERAAGAEEEHLLRRGLRHWRVFRHPARRDFVLQHRHADRHGRAHPLAAASRAAARAPTAAAGGRTPVAAAVRAPAVSQSVTDAHAAAHCVFARVLGARASERQWMWIGVWIGTWIVYGTFRICPNSLSTWNSGPSRGPAGMASQRARE